MKGQDLLGSRLPIAAAPMAGGPSTVKLAHAVSAAGGFPFLAGGYKTASALSEQITEVRQHTRSFGVNLFVPSARQQLDLAHFRRYVEDLRAEAEVYGLALEPVPVVDDDQWEQKLAMLLAAPVPVVSLTFGLPDNQDIAQLQSAGTRVLATVTTPAEATLAEAAGVDGLIVQGPRAGGHSATFDPQRIIQDAHTATLLAQVRETVQLPLLGAGGIDDPEAVRTLLHAGAQAVVVGTLLLRAHEAGTSAAHRSALANRSFSETTITHAFTGRPARALRNGFIDRHNAHAPFAYPQVHHLTRELRQAAAAAGDTDRLHLWAGTGYRSAQDQPAARIIEWLAQGVGKAQH